MCVMLMHKSYTYIYIYAYIYNIISLYVYVCINMVHRPMTNAVDLSPHSRNTRVYPSSLQMQQTIASAVVRPVNSPVRASFSYAAWMVKILFSSRCSIFINCADGINIMLHHLYIHYPQSYPMFTICFLPIWRFPKSWGYPQAMDDHFVLKPRVTWGFPHLKNPPYPLEI